MIAQRNTSYNSMEMNEERAMQAVLALFNERHPAHTSRWDCEVCGMIHLGQMPPACDSCGNALLTSQANLHCEMNNHW